MRRLRGFSLVELLITVAIVGILAAIAVPSYRDYIKRGKITEATATLAEQRVKMEQYFQDNRKYRTGTTGTTCGVTMPTTPKYFNVTCTAADQTFTITAAGKTSGSDVSMSGFSYTINETNAKTTTMSAPATTDGWATNASCWVTRKPSTC